MTLVEHLRREGCLVILDSRFHAKAPSTEATSVVWVGGDRDEEALSAERDRRGLPWVILGASGKVFIMRQGEGGPIWVQSGSALRPSQQRSGFALGAYLADSLGEKLTDLLPKAPPTPKKSKATTPPDTTTSAEDDSASPEDGSTTDTATSE